MCATNKLVSIFRHGINNDNIGPIAKASFEETPEMFLRAARHAEFDPMRGVSANVMCGQLGNFGTSAFQVVLDMDKMRDVKSKQLKEEKELSLQEAFQVEDPEDACAKSNIKISQRIGGITQTVPVGDDDDYNISF